MSDRYPGGLIRKTPPTIVGPVDGEGGSAPGIWTLEQASYYQGTGEWPKPVLPKELFAWGDNGNGALGSGSVVFTSSPIQIGALGDWSVIAEGQNSSYAVRSNGTLWAWGNDSSGALGQGVSAVSQSSPTQIGSLTNWANVWGGTEQGFAVTTAGAMYSWGNGANGGLAQNNLVLKSSPTQVGALTNWEKGTSCEGYHTHFIKTDGTLWGVGKNSSGLVGDNTTINRSSPVQIGSDTWLDATENLIVAAIKSNGTLWAWGQAVYGLGNGTTVYASSPVQVGALTTWSNVGGNGRTTYAIRNDGTLWAWGYDGFGMLGVGTRSINMSSPVQVGAETYWSQAAGGDNISFALTTAKTLFSWGNNGNGALGQNTPITLDRSSPVQIGTDTNWNQIADGAGAWRMAKKIG